jgi:hypothetical protein
MDRPNAPTVLHVIAAWASDTAHDDAVYRVDPAPGAWYVAEMAVSPTGPRLLPRMVTSTPPAVGMLPRLLPTATDSESMEGTVYDDVTAMSVGLVVKPDTVTFQRWLAPTPTTVLHVSDVCGTDTVQATATYFPYTTDSAAAPALAMLSADPK